MNNIILDKAENFLNTIESDTVNLIAIDPPYEINYLNSKWDTPKTLNWEYLFLEFNRILKDDGNLIIFQGWSNVCETITASNNIFELKNWIIYDRIKGRGAKTNLVSTREDILWFIKGKNYTYNKILSNHLKKTKGMGEKNGTKYRAMSNVWTDISPLVPWSAEKVNHPTQKPLALMERIVNIWSNPGDLVLDCFAGSGSTLVAAKKLNRNYIGCELSETYFNIAKERLENS